MNEKEIQLLNQLAATQSEQAFYQNATSNSLLVKKLVRKIKSRRLELNLSQEALADKCSLDRTYISLVERSKRNPSYLTLIKICEGLEINLKKLLGNNSKPIKR